MTIYHMTMEEVLAWDDIQFGFFVCQADRFGRWLWNFFPPEVGGKDKHEAKANADAIRASMPALLLPSEERFEDARAESKFHGLIGPQS